MRRAVSLLLVVGLLAALGGCAMIKPKPKPTPAEVRQQMLDYLAAKYGREFEVSSMNTRGFDAGDRDVMEAYPAGGNKADTFRVYREGDTFDPVMSDGYVGYVMRDQYEAMARPIVEAHFTEFRLVVGNPGVSRTFPADFTPDMSFEQFHDYLSSHGGISFNVFIPWDAPAPDPGFQTTAKALVDDIKAQVGGEGYATVHGYDPSVFQIRIVEDENGFFERFNTYPIMLAAQTYHDEWLP
ncbi:MAG: hypothetical protein LBK42_10480 [Propionibacteriaceae bacterium]|jgi:hypothetical protein|nr:hypothetical protein [Propionibacteriaceae bacterium]